MIDSVPDLIEVLDTLNKRDDIEELVEEVLEYSVLASTNPKILDSDDGKLRDIVEQLEMCLSYYLFFESGIINKAAQTKLNKIGFNISKLEAKDYGFTHEVGSDRFSILFSL